MFASRFHWTACVALIAIGAFACTTDSVSPPIFSAVALDTQVASGNSVAAATVAQVYASDFSSAASMEWTNARTSVSPSGERFLGEFSNESTALQLNNMAAHDSVTVSFDLYIIRSWDGVDPNCGPDNFTLIADGVTLLNTMFSNMQGRLQNYPYAAADQKAVWRDGAVATNSLGFTVAGMQDLDSTYHLTFTFAHVSSSLRVSLAAMGLQSIADESWGVDNVEISIRQ